MRSMIVPGVVLMMGVLAGCGADGAEKQDTAAVGVTIDPQSTCRADFEREIGCRHAPGDESTYVQECQKEIACQSTLLIADYINGFYPCALALECLASDDHCGDEVIQKQVAIPEVKSLYDSCMKRYEDCCGAAGDCAFADDDCVLILVAQPAVRSKLAACLTTPSCPDLAACFNTVLAPYHQCMDEASGTSR